MCLQYYNQKNSNIAKSTPSQNSKSYTVFRGFFFFKNLYSQCRDIEKSPGPKYSSLRFCHWDLNGFSAHDCIKITLIQAYIADQNFDTVCLSETFLNSSVQNDDHKLKIDGYNLIRSDHPSDPKKAGVCFYYKEHIPLIRCDIFALYIIA